MATQDEIAQQVYAHDSNATSLDSYLELLDDTNTTSKEISTVGYEKIKVYLYLANAPGSQPEVRLQETDFNKNTWVTTKTFGKIGQGLHVFKFNEMVYKFRLDVSGGSSYSIEPTIILSP